MKLDPQREGAGQDRLVLASALHGLRKASGLSGDRLARRCGMSQSKISRIENARMTPTVLDVEQILTALDVDSTTRAELVELAKLANAEFQDDRTFTKRGRHHRQRDLAALEAAATEIRHFLPTLITGLLQTPEYMRTAMDPPWRATTGDSNRTLSLKLQRRAVLYDASKQFHFLLTESALRWRLCPPAVMAIQLDHLVSLSHLPNVRIGVLPLDRETPQGAFHTFVTYDRRLVTAELFTGQLVLRDPKDVEHYRDLFDFFAELSLWGDDARHVLREQAAAFRSTK